MDFDDRVGAVVIAGQQGFELDFLGTPHEPLDGIAQVRSDVLPFPGQVEEGLRVVEKLAEPLGRLDRLRKPRTSLLDRFGFVRVAPDVGVGQASFQFVELALLGLDIKGTSAATPLSLGALRFFATTLEDQA